MSVSDVMIGITGHQALSPATRNLIRNAVSGELGGMRNFTVITSLAAGADQICAETALQAGGRLLVITPARDYIESFGDSVDLENYQRLLARADEVVTLSFIKPSEQAYWAAGQEIVHRAELILAIWDGKPAGGLGGTADVVQYARLKGKEVRVIWPYGAQRA